MPTKLLCFDVETTGLNPEINDIIQLSGQIIINGKVEENFNLRVRPLDFDNIDAKAIETHGVTIEEMKEYPSANSIYHQFARMLNKYVDKFNRNDKFVPYGYNVRFDIDFLHQFFKKQGDNYLFSFLSGYPIDVYQEVLFFHHVGLIPRLKNFCLETVAPHFDVPIQAHDAMSDIEATRKLHEIFVKTVKGIKLYDPENDLVKGE